MTRDTTDNVSDITEALRQRRLCAQILPTFTPTGVEPLSDETVDVRFAGITTARAALAARLSAEEADRLHLEAKICRYGRRQPSDTGARTAVTDRTSDVPRPLVDREAIG
jgi:hypothetical protein